VGLVCDVESCATAITGDLINSVTDNTRLYTEGLEGQGWLFYTTTEDHPL